MSSVVVRVLGSNLNDQAGNPTDKYTTYRALGNGAKTTGDRVRGDSDNVRSVHN